MTTRWLVVGLGNPGPGYAGNRHNVGFMVARRAGRRGSGGRFKAHKAARRRRRGPARPAGARGAGQAAVVHERVRRPGRRRCATSTRCPLERVVVVHDELDLPFGALRLKLGGGDNGHNGLRRSPARSAPVTTTGSGSASGGRRAGWTPRPSCCGTSRATERKELDLDVDRAADAVEALLDRGPRAGPEHLQHLTDPAADLRVSA